MKLATVSAGDRSFPAIVVGDGYIDVAKYLAGASTTMIGLISQWHERKARSIDAIDATILSRAEPLSHPTATNS